jgi:hypothetical protein
VVELGRLCTKTRFDVAQTLAVGQLGECHREILIPARKVFQIPITTITGYALLKLLVRKELDHLGENGASSVHPALSLPPEIPPSPLLAPFALQIVFTPKSTYHTESRMVAH